MCQTQQPAFPTTLLVPHASSRLRAKSHATLHTTAHETCSEAAQVALVHGCCWGLRIVTPNVPDPSERSGSGRAALAGSSTPPHQG